MVELKTTPELMLVAGVAVPVVAVVIAAIQVVVIIINGIENTNK